MTERIQARRKAAKDEDHTNRLTALRAKVSDAQNRLARLYAAIENGVADPVDQTLKERIAAVKTERDIAQAAFDRALTEISPQARITEEKIAAFVEIMRANVLTGDTHCRCIKLRRFAVHLAHRHFVLGPDEVLIERPDPDGRTQHVTVGRLSDEPEARPTTWLFDDGPELLLSAAVYCVCVSDPDKTEVCIRHGKGRSPDAASQKDEVAKERRISEEKGRHERGFPVGGHDEGRTR